MLLSFLASQPLARGLLGDVLEALTSTYAEGKRGGAGGSAPKALRAKQQGRTVKEGETEEMARLKSLTLPHAGDWVNALLWGFTCDSRSKGRHLIPNCLFLAPLAVLLE